MRRAVLLALVAAAGCGGDPDGSGFALEESAGCFRERGGHVVSSADSGSAPPADRARRAALRIAAEDGDGALSVPAGGGRTTIVFARDEEQAAALAARNRRILREGGVPSETAQRLVERRENAVLLWPEPPDVETADSVAECLVSE